MKNRAGLWVMTLFTMAMLMLLLACGAAEESFFLGSQQSADMQYGKPEPAALKAKEAGMVMETEAMSEEGFGSDFAAREKPSAPGFDDGRGLNSNRPSLQVIDRKVISRAKLSIEVESVEPAVGQARAISESLGGFVEQLSSSGGAENPRADLTVRVPQPQFGPALARIEALGEVQSRDLGQEDVTEQFIDLAAWLKSSQREEQSLLALLERSNSVTEILTVERELARVRSTIEQTQGRLNFLERRVDLATINVSLFPPGALPTNPPIANYTLDVAHVSDRVARLKNFVAGLDGEIDQVHLMTYENEERANVSFRVFVQDFNRTVEFIEGQGRVELRELNEGINLSKDEAPRAKRPGARIEVAYVEKAFNFQPWLIIFILLFLLAMAGTSAFLMRLAYRRGRMRGSFF